MKESWGAHKLLFYYILYCLKREPVVPKTNFRLKVVPTDGAQTASCRSLREKNPRVDYSPVIRVSSFFTLVAIFWQKPCSGVKMEDTRIPGKKKKKTWREVCHFEEVDRLQRCPNKVTAKVHKVRKTNRYTDTTNWEKQIEKHGKILSGSWHSGHSQHLQNPDAARSSVQDFPAPRLECNFTSFPSTDSRICRRQYDLKFASIM